MPLENIRQSLNIIFRDDFKVIELDNNDVYDI